MAGSPEAATLDSQGREVLQLQSHCVEERELSDDLGDCLQRKSLQFVSQEAASCVAAATPDNLGSLVRLLHGGPICPQASWTALKCSQLLRADKSWIFGIDKELCGGSHPRQSRASGKAAAPS